MENLLKTLIEQHCRTNDLLEKQQRMMGTQQVLFKTQQEFLNLLNQRITRIEDLLCLVADILDRDLLSLLDQPLLLKQDVMKKLNVVDSTYRSYVNDKKLRPMVLGKIEYYFPRDLHKTLLETKYRRER